MGLVPYITTGAHHSAAGMNDLYSSMDSVLNYMTNGKSLYFMNGFSRYFIPETSMSATSAPYYMTESADEYLFGLGGGTVDMPSTDYTSSPKKYYFLDGAKHLDSTGQCVDSSIASEYGGKMDCMRKRCGNYADCFEEALVPAGEWGWFYKLVGQYGWDIGATDVQVMPLGGDMSAWGGYKLDYETYLHPRMKKWESTFMPIDVSVKQQLVLGAETAILQDSFKSTCADCNDGKWMTYEDSIVDKLGNVLSQNRTYEGYLHCHSDKCKDTFEGVKWVWDEKAEPYGEWNQTSTVVDPSGGAWDWNFQQMLSCKPFGEPCLSPKIGDEGTFSFNLQHSLGVPKLNGSVTVYEMVKARPGPADENLSGLLQNKWQRKAAGFSSVGSAGGETQIGGAAGGGSAGGGGGGAGMGPGGGSSSSSFTAAGYGHGGPGMGPGMGPGGSTGPGGGGGMDPGGGGGGGAGCNCNGSIDDSEECKKDPANCTTSIRNEINYDVWSKKEQFGADGKSTSKNKGDDVNYSSEADKTACYRYYCNKSEEEGLGENAPETKCCEQVPATTKETKEVPVKWVIYDLNEARLISYGTSCQQKDSHILHPHDKLFGFVGEVPTAVTGHQGKNLYAAGYSSGEFAAGYAGRIYTDEMRFEHPGWCWERAFDKDSKWKRGSYNYSGSCPREKGHAGRLLEDAEDSNYRLTFGCGVLNNAKPTCGIPEHLPNLENRWAQAELIFDGRAEKYQKFKFSNEYNKYKFFRIHNLNNYAMEFEFEADKDFPGSQQGQAGGGQAETTAKGLWGKGDSKFVVGECSAGPGIKITIPANESRCIRRDWGVYTVGFTHFQKFIKGDSLYQLELSQARDAVRGAYPKYYDYYDKTWRIFQDATSNNIVNPFIIDDYIKKFNMRFDIDPTPPRVWDSSGLYMGAGGYQSPEPISSSLPEYPGTRSSDDVVEQSTRGHKVLWGSQPIYNSSSYNLMKTPHHTNFYQEGVSHLNRKESILADFLYHTGWALQVYHLRSGDFKHRPGCPSCVEKRLIPYKGAKHVHDFINDMNVNVLPVNATGQVIGIDEKLENPYANPIAHSDQGISGFTTAPPHMFYWKGHYAGDPVDEYGNTKECEGCGRGVSREWKSVPSFSSAADIILGSDPLEKFGFDYNLLGPTDLRYVRHHAYSPNSGSYIGMELDAGGRKLRDLGYWGEMKDRDKWPRGRIIDTPGAGCLTLKNDMAKQHASNIAKSKKQIQAGDKYGNDIAPFNYTASVGCGDSDRTAQNLGFETRTKCDRSFAAQITVSPSILVTADDEDLAVEEAVLECKKWNSMRFGAGVKRIGESDCEDSNIVGLKKNSMKAKDRSMPCWAGAKEGCDQDNTDPYAYSMHQLPISTNILGGNDFFGLKGQLYPVPRIGLACEDWKCIPSEGEVVSVPREGDPYSARPTLHSRIDFINEHSIKFGAYFYSRVPKPYGFKDLRVETQGYRRNSMGWGGAKRCYPLASDNRGDLDWLSLDHAGTLGMNWGCTTSTVSQPVNMGGNNQKPSQVAMSDCPSWTNATIMGMQNPGRLFDDDFKGNKNAFIGQNYKGCFDHRGARTCSDADANFGKIQLLTIPYKSIDKEYRQLHGETLGPAAIENLLSKNSTTLKREHGAAGSANVGTQLEVMQLELGNEDGELLGLKGQTAKFEYASTVDEMYSVSTNRNLNTPHSYKYSYWWANPRNHIMIADGGGGKFGKHGWDCTLHDDFLDKDYLKCGLIAADNGDENYHGGNCVNEKGQIVRKPGIGSKATCEDAGLTWDQKDAGMPWRYACEGCGPGSDQHGYAGATVPVNRSQIIPIAASYVPDPPITDFIPNRELPLHYSHDYSEQGGARWAVHCTPCDDGCWKSWMCSRADEKGGTWPSEVACRKANAGFQELGEEGELRQCGTDVIDDDGAVVPFHEGKGWSAYGYAGGKKAKSEWHARKDMFNMTLQDLHLGMRQFSRYDGTAGGGGQWTGYNIDGRVDYNADWWWPPYGVHNDEMPVQLDYDSLYKSCCTDHCNEWFSYDGTVPPVYGWWTVGCTMDQVNNGGGYGKEYRELDGTLVVTACGYKSERECRAGEAELEHACSFDASFVLSENEPNWGTIKGIGYPISGHTAEENVQYCKDRAHRDISLRYTSITAPSPPGMLETSSSFNASSSYAPSLHDTKAALNQWQFPGAGGVADGNATFLDKLGYVFMQNEAAVIDPFNGNWVKPFYGENAKFSYGWQKNLNLRYKFENSFQSWGGDVKGMTRSQPFFETNFQWSKAKGPGFDNAGNLTQNKTTPVVYHRRADVVATTRYFQGGWPSTPLKIGTMSFPESNKNLRNVQHGMSTAAPIGVNRFEFFNTWDPAVYSNPNDVSMKYFFNTNRTKEVFAYRQPICSSSYLTGDLGAGPFHALYHPTGIMWTHPDIYLKEARLEHILSEARDFAAIDGAKEIIGYHREYSPIDSRFRMGREVRTVGCSVGGFKDVGKRWTDWTDIEGPTQITWDKHLHKYGPPRRAYEITGIAVPMGLDGPSAKGYWPACRAVYAAMGYVINTDDCLKKHFKTEGSAPTNFIKHWLQYEDYCPKLQFLRWNGTEPHDYYSERWKKFTEPCYECGGEKWRLHKTKDGLQKYPFEEDGNGELDCRRGDQKCSACDNEKWKIYPGETTSQKYATEAECRDSYCEDDKKCCGRCSIDIGVREGGDSAAYREMDIVPSGYPILDCNGAVIGVKLFETVKDLDGADDDCQSCINNWDDGLLDGTIKGSLKPDRGGGAKFSLPHFYDYKPMVSIEPPKLWPPPQSDIAGLDGSADYLGCNEAVIKPDKWGENNPNRPSPVNVMPLVHETWTGISIISGNCPADVDASQAGREDGLRLSWPSKNEIPIFPIGYRDSSLGEGEPVTWYGNSKDTYSAHGGLDISYYGDINDVGVVPVPASVWEEMMEDPDPVYAAAPGTVVYVIDGYGDQCNKGDWADPVHGKRGTKCGGGDQANLVIIDHGEETKLGYRYTSYLHFKKDSIIVEEGDTVRRGQKLGEIGSSGYSSYPHLHFAVGNKIYTVGEQKYLNVKPGVTTVEPFNMDPKKSLWVDQCSLPIFQIPGQTMPRPPACFSSFSPNWDVFLDKASENIQAYFMAERNCADHRAGCCKLDWALSTTSAITQQNFHSWYHLPVDKACHLRVNIASKAHNRAWSDSVGDGIKWDDYG